MNSNIDPALQILRIITSSFWVLGSLTFCGLHSSMKSYWKIGSSKGKRPIWILLLWQRLGGFFDFFFFEEVGLVVLLWVVWNNGVVGVYLVSASHVQMRFHKDLTLVSFPQLCWYKGGIPRTTLKTFYKLDMSFSSNLHSVNTSFQKFILCIVEVISGCFIDLMLLIKTANFWKGFEMLKIVEAKCDTVVSVFS